MRRLGRMLGAPQTLIHPALVGIQMARAGLVDLAQPG
jgi:hypothetical protein